jgi:hypothetical protein
MTLLKHQQRDPNTKKRIIKHGRGGKGLVITFGSATSS